MNHSHANQVLPTSFKYTEIEVLDSSFDVIFPTFFSKFKLNVDNQSILDECLNLKKDDPEGVKKSNIFGWQSQIYSLFGISRDLLPSIQNLAFNTVLAANDISQNYDFGLEFSEHGCDWWININEKFCYNVVHSHPGCEIVALYYPKISFNCDNDINEGTLNLLRTDGSHQCGLYEKNNEHSNYAIAPEVGTLYLFPSHILHYVTPNLEDTQRISIAFNLKADK